MLARGILGSGRTWGVSFPPFPNSSGWWWLISSVFLIRISCHKTTHANSYYGAWPGWAVSISVLPLTELPGSFRTMRTQQGGARYEALIWPCTSSFQNPEKHLLCIRTCLWDFSSLQGLRHEGCQKRESVLVSKLDTASEGWKVNSLPPKKSIS